MLTNLQALVGTVFAFGGDSLANLTSAVGTVSTAWMPPDFKAALSANLVAVRVLVVGAARARFARVDRAFRATEKLGEKVAARVRGAVARVKPAEKSAETITE